jgi:hypothetical protein
MKDGDDKKSTVKEALELLCAPAITDTIEDIDFEKSDDAAEQTFLRPKNRPLNQSVKALANLTQRGVNVL